MSLAYRSEESRRTPREAVDYPSQIWLNGPAPCAALIVNVSPHGCMIRSDRTVSIGERVTVAMPGVGELSGTVIWFLGARFGVEFVEAIELEPYLAMLSVLKARFREEN